MKKFILNCLFFVIPLISFSQNGHRFESAFFLGRQPSAAAEAMGKAYVSLDGDLGSIFFNPAGIARIEKTQIYNSYTPPPAYFTLKGFYLFNSLNYRISPYLNVALSRFRFNVGENDFHQRLYDEKFTATIASEPFKNLLLGFNANYFNWTPRPGTATHPVFFDFGFIKKFPIGRQKKQQYINAGASVSNFTKASTTAHFSDFDVKYYLPIISRYGLSFNFSFGKRSFFDSGSTIQVLVQSDYQLLLNSKYKQGIRLGGQFTIFDVLSLRSGYYQENDDIYNLPEENKRSIASFTYGGGIALPLYLWTKIPVKICFDYTILPQVNPTYFLPDFPKFSTYTLTITYERKKE